LKSRAGKKHKQDLKAESRRAELAKTNITKMSEGDKAKTNINNLGS
jgi:hypothetical protein